MLKKTQRLNLTCDFKRIAVSAKKIHSRHFSVFFIIQGNDMPLVGVALAKKEFRKSHQRNRARRLVAEAVQRHYDRLSKGLQLVIMPKAGVLEIPVEELSNEFGAVSPLYKIN